MSVQDSINKILWDRRYVTIPNDIEKPDSFGDIVVLRDMTLADRNYYDLIRRREEMAARQMGVDTEAELLLKARQADFWTKVEDEIEAKADDHIAFLEGEMKRQSRFRSRTNIIKLQIADAIAKKKHVQNKRNQLRIASAEYLAHEISALALLRRVLYSIDDQDNLLLDDDQCFLRLRSEYPDLLFFLVGEVMHEGVFAVPEIREIARSTEWRLVWTLTRENLTSIFNRSVGDLCINHKLLIYWSRIYDSAFETPEPPEQDVINDDDKFDDWLANRDWNTQEGKDKRMSRVLDHQEQGRMLDGEYVEECSCGAKIANRDKYLGERVSHANDCLYGTWHQFTDVEKRQLSDRIYGRNSNRIRNMLDKEQDKVLSRGMVEEQHLRDKQTRQTYGLQTKIVTVNK